MLVFLVKLYAYFAAIGFCISVSIVAGAAYFRSKRLDYKKYPLWIAMSDASELMKPGDFFSLDAEQYKEIKKSSSFHGLSEIAPRLPTKYIKTGFCGEYNGFPIIVRQLGE